MPPYPPVLTSAPVESDLVLDGTHLLKDDLIVHAPATLTIEPGTRLVATRRGIRIVIHDGARLVAMGTRNQPVVLAAVTSPIVGPAPAARTAWGESRAAARDQSVMEHVHWQADGPILTFGMLEMYSCRTRCTMPTTGAVT